MDRISTPDSMFFHGDLLLLLRRPFAQWLGSKERIELIPVFYHCVAHILLLTFLALGSWGEMEPCGAAHSIRASQACPASDRLVGAVTAKAQLGAWHQWTPMQHIP
jgi:hypothetical protein